MNYKVNYKKKREIQLTDHHRRVYEHKEITRAFAVLSPAGGYVLERFEGVRVGQRGAPIGVRGEAMG